MAEEGRMSRYTNSINGQYSPVTPKPGAGFWAQEPMQEMERISPAQNHAYVNGNGPAHGQRWSGGLQAEHSPLREQTDVVGPAPNQVQDHNLHELYFGPMGDEDGLVDQGPSQGHPMGMPEQNGSGLGIHALSQPQPQAYGRDQGEEEVIAGPSNANYAEQYQPPLHQEFYPAPGQEFAPHQQFSPAHGQGFEHVHDQVTQRQPRQDERGEWI